jgi:mycothione reductase
VCTPVPLKHVANEAEVVRHNPRHPDDLTSVGHDLA